MSAPSPCGRDAAHRALDVDVVDLVLGIEDRAGLRVGDEEPLLVVRIVDVGALADEGRRQRRRDEHVVDARPHDELGLGEREPGDHLVGGEDALSGLRVTDRGHLDVAGADLAKIGAGKNQREAGVVAHEQLDLSAEDGNVAHVLGVHDARELVAVGVAVVHDATHVAVTQILAPRRGNRRSPRETRRRSPRASRRARTPGRRDAACAHRP